MRIVLWTRCLAIAALRLFLRQARRRIKLITLPVRERVEIQLDNPNATLVEEERIVPLVKGENQVDFSWANTQIDPDTIVFRVVGPAGEKQIDAKVLSVSYPPNEASLVWAVGASDSGSARVRISYILGNLSKALPIAPSPPTTKRPSPSRSTCACRISPTRSSAAAVSGRASARNSSSRSASTKPRRCSSAKFDEVPVRKTYTCDPQEFGYLDQPQNKLRVPMHYVLKNDKADNSARRRCPTARSAFSSDGHRIRTSPPRSSAKTGASSRRSTTR